MSRDSVFDFITGHKETTASNLIHFFWNRCEQFKTGLSDLLAKNSDGGLTAAEVGRNGEMFTEYPAGKGRVDILIKTSRIWFVIENKFAAEYKNKQIEDYLKSLYEFEKNVPTLLPVLVFPKYREASIRRELDRAAKPIHTLRWEEVSALTKKTLESYTGSRLGVLLQEFIDFIRTRTEFKLDCTCISPDTTDFSFEEVSRFVQELYWILGNYECKMYRCSGNDKYPTFGYRAFRFLPPNVPERLYWLGCDWQKSDMDHRRSHVRLFVVSAQREFQLLKGVEKGTCTWNNALSCVQLEYRTLAELCSAKDGSQFAAFILELIGV